MALPKFVHVQECGPRDGLQIEAKALSVSEKAEKNLLPRRMPKTAVDSTSTISGTMAGFPCRKCCAFSRADLLWTSKLATLVSLPERTFSKSCGRPTFAEGSVISLVSSRGAVAPRKRSGAAAAPP